MHLPPPIHEPREARQIIGEFIQRYNTEWLIERLGHRTPAAARAQALVAA